MSDGWSPIYDDAAIEYLTYAILAYDAALVMLSDTQPVLFPRSLCRGVRTAELRKRKRSGKPSRRTRKRQPNG